VGPVDELVTALEAEAPSAAPANGTSNNGATPETPSAASELATTSDTVPTDILSLFRWVVAAVVGFYFASTTIEKLAGKAGDGGSTA
jgi:hypothetical protein